MGMVLRKSNSILQRAELVEENKRLLKSNSEMLEVLQELVYRKDDKQFGRALLRAMGIFNANNIKR